VNRGVSLYTVQGLLGHTQPRTTQRYAHLAPQTLLDATELISEAIGKPEPSEEPSSAVRSRPEMALCSRVKTGP
jgi:hypothetical protein